MSVILNKVWENYNYVFYELADDRTRDFWPNNITTLSILLVYLYFVKKAGPAWMKGRKPYELKNTIIVYNIFQIIASAYLSYEGSKLWFKEYNFTCQPVDYSNSPIVKSTHNLVWMYYSLKLIDLLDTVFFVLRKKNRQISALHLYHHFMMPICAWLGITYYPNGHGISLGLINSFVHTVMYTYYLISGLGPQYQKYLWWKKHLTTIQLLQFVIVFIHNMIPLIIGCSYPRWINMTLSINSIHFIYMFGNFYYVNYIKKEIKHKKQN